ncbi:hypothetical protein Tco_0121201 [Tanacetum coccineum]
MITNSQEYLSSRVRSLESIINELRFKIQELHREIIQIIRTSPTTQPSSSISQKEAEMKNLKNQLQDLERQHKQKRITSLIDDPWRLPSTPFVGVSFDPQPLPQSYTHTTSPSLNIWASEQRRLKPSTRKEPTFSQESQSIADVVASTKTPDVLPIQKVNPVSMFLNSLTQTDKPQNPQFIAPVIKPQKDYEEFDNVESFEHLFMAEPENAESTVQFDAEEYEEHQENPNQETPTEFPKSDIKQYFTFDDVPPSKWRERSIEMLTWCTAELQYYTIDVVIKRFLTRLQGRLRDWYHSLGEYRQLQIQQSISPEAFMSIIYSEFIGSPWEHTTHAREEFLKMKCCSFQKKDLEKHYDRMSQRFYCLNGVDDVNLKQVFLNSFPESLGNEAYRALEARNVTIAQTTLGELYQLILNALAKLCNQKRFLAEFERTGKRLGTTCDDKYLPAEATLNWQSENVVAQNKVLVKILSQQGVITNSQEYLSSRVRSLESIINELRFKIQELHREIIQIIRTSPTTQPSSSISQKEAEMKNLKNQLQDLERQHKQKRITSLIDDPWRLPSTPFVGVSFDPQP